MVISGEYDGDCSVYFFRIEVPNLETGHVFRQTHGLVADTNRMLDDSLELVLCVAGAELPRVGVHRERHGELMEMCVYWVVGLSERN